MGKTNKPKLRFPNFTDDWEQRKLKDFGKATGGTSIESEFSEDGKYKVISIGSYSEDSVYRDQGIRAIESEKTKNRVLNEGDLTMILNDKTASGNIIGRVLLIEKSGVYVYNQRTERIEIDHEKFDSLFIYEMLNAPNVRDKIIKQSQGNTQIYVNWPTIAETDYLVPKIEEQRYLGKFFYNLDNLITLHQRKLDEVREYKRGLLQKMFPRDGEKVPELRFPGFTDDWEQCKLGECLSEITYGFTNPMSDTENGPWKITAKDIVDGKIDFSSARHTSIIEYDGLTDKSKPIIGDLLLTKDGTLGRTAIVNAENICINQSVALLRFNEKCSAQYAKTLLDTPMYQKQMLDDAGGGTIKHIYITKVDKMFIPIPSKKEQERLVSFFDNLDNLITLHQRKLDAMKEYMRGLLKQMFV